MLIHIFAYLHKLFCYAQTHFHYRAGSDREESFENPSYHEEGPLMIFQSLFLALL